MRKLIGLILALSLPINSFAAVCPKPVIKLEEGTPAPCGGYLFSESKESEVRVQVLENSLLQQENDSLNKIINKLSEKEQHYNQIIELEEKKTELWKTRAEDITQKYVSVEQDRYKRDFGFVLLGIGLTALAGWTLGQINSGR